MGLCDLSTSKTRSQVTTSIQGYFNALQHIKHWVKSNQRTFCHVGYPPLICTHFVTYDFLFCLKYAQVRQHLRTWSYPVKHGESFRHRHPDMTTCHLPPPFPAMLVHHLLGRRRNLLPRKLMTRTPCFVPHISSRHRQSRKEEVTPIQTTCRWPCSTEFRRNPPRPQPTGDEGGKSEVTNDATGGSGTATSLNHGSFRPVRSTVTNLKPKKEVRLHWVSRGRGWINMTIFSFINQNREKNETEKLWLSFFNSFFCWRKFFHFFLERKPFHAAARDRLSSKNKFSLIYLPLWNCSQNSV